MRNSPRQQTGEQQARGEKINAGRECSKIKRPRSDCGAESESAIFLKIVGAAPWTRTSESSSMPLPGL